MASSLLTSLFLKKQKLEIVKSFQDIAIIDKVSPGGSEWQKPPGNKQNNSKVENHHLNSALVAQSSKNHQGINKFKSGKPPIQNETDKALVAQSGKNHQGKHCMKISVNMPKVQKPWAEVPASGLNSHIGLRGNKQKRCKNVWELCLHKQTDNKGN